MNLTEIYEKFTDKELATITVYWQVTYNRPTTKAEIPFLDLDKTIESLRPHVNFDHEIESIFNRLVRYKADLRRQAWQATVKAIQDGTYISPPPIVNYGVRYEGDGKYVLFSQEGNKVTFESQPIENGDSVTMPNGNVLVFYSDLPK